MTSIEQTLSQRSASALDAYEDFTVNADPESIDDMKQALPLAAASIVSQWVAGFQIKTHHELMISSINAIR